jgi:hypothetical protein
MVNENLLCFSIRPGLFYWPCMIRIDTRPFPAPLSVELHDRPFAPNKYKTATRTAGGRFSIQ